MVIPHQVSAMQITSLHYCKGGVDVQPKQHGTSCGMFHESEASESENHICWSKFRILLIRFHLSQT